MDDLLVRAEHNFIALWKEVIKFLYVFTVIFNFSLSRLELLPNGVSKLLCCCGLFTSNFYEPLPSLHCHAWQVTPLSSA
jgi:hypothetical protein